MGMDLTPYFCLSSLERGADMSFLLMWEGASKCLLRCFLRLEVTFLFSFMANDVQQGKIFVCKEKPVQF